MYKFRKLVAPLTFSVALILSATANGTPMEHRDHGLRHMLSQLDLTQSQRQDIRMLVKQNRANRNLYRQDMHGLFADLHTLIRSDQWDQDGAKALINQHLEFMAQIDYQKATNQQQIWTLLNEQQQSEFIQLLEKQAENPRHREKDHDMLQRLNLSDEQQTQIEQLKLNMQNSKDAFNTQRQLFQQAKLALIQSGSLDESSWQNLRTQYQDVFTNAALSKANFKHQIWQLLTAQQQQQLAEKMARHQARQQKHSRDQDKSE